MAYASDLSATGTGTHFCGVVYHEGLFWINSDKRTVGVRSIIFLMSSVHRAKQLGLESLSEQWLFSQVPATGPYPEPNESALLPDTHFSKDPF
jgi:hypothetical protein